MVISQNFGLVMEKKQLLSKLPTIYRNPVNESLFGNAFQHLLDGDEQLQMSIVVGDETNVVENTPFRKTDQLQPYMVSDVGTEVRATSFEDVLSWLSKSGVDVSKIVEWANQSRFTFMPPFDLDKFNNYSNYYWVADSKPDYITIKNRYRQLAVYCNEVYLQYPTIKELCNTKPRTPQVLNQINNMVQGFALYHDEYVVYLQRDPQNQITEFGWDGRPWDEFGSNTYQTLVAGLDLAQHDSFVTVSGDFSTILTTSNPFVVNVTNTASANGEYVVVAAVYDQSVNRTIVTLTPSVSPSMLNGGKLFVANFTDVYSFDPTTELSIVPTSTRMQNDDWSSNNNWVHVSELSSYANLTNYHKAEMPIIEYDPYISMCVWYKNQREWKYNGTQTGLQPTHDEIESHKYVESPSVAYGRYVRVTSNFVNKINQFNLNEFTIQVGSVYTYAKIVTVQPITPTDFSQYDILTDVSFDTVDLSQIKLHPMRVSSRGDDWKGFTNHWIATGKVDLVPIYKPNEYGTNATPYHFLTENDAYASIHNTSQLVTTIKVESAPRRIFDISTSIGSQYWPKSGTGDLRVYVNGRRVYNGFSVGTTNNSSLGSYTIANDGDTYNCVILDSPVKYSTVEICVGGYVDSDYELTNVPVRFVDGTTKLLDLFKYSYVEQQKTTIGQYPLFNCFDHNGNHTGSSTSIWKYVRSFDSNVNTLLNERIELAFVNDLIRDGKLLFVRQCEQINAVPTARGCWNRASNAEPVLVEGEPTLIEQFKYNPENITRSAFRYDYTLTHFQQIINAQPTPWFKQIQAVPMPGSIRMYTGNIDILWAFAHADMPSVPEMLYSAKNQYVQSLARVRQLTRDGITKSTFANVTAYAETIVDGMQHGNMFIPDSTSGVPGFIDTPCTFGWLPPTIPKAVMYKGNIVLTHHDGHDSAIVVSADEHDQFIRNLIKLGYIVTNQLPSIFNSISSLGYIVNGKAYKAKQIEYVPSIPTSMVPGTIYAVIGTQTVAFMNNGQPYSTSSQSACWAELELDQLIASVTLHFEMALYNKAVTKQPKYVSPHASQMYASIQSFVRKTKLDPSVTTDYDASNPFTWNYQDYTNNPSVSRWYTLYETIYGTRYPHMEPWKILKYQSKPLWWDAEFADLTGQRVWQQRMWSFVRSGCVPAGRATATGIVSSGKPGDVTYNGTGRIAVPIAIPVYDQNYGFGDYALDDLLPPHIPGVGPHFEYTRVVNSYSASSARKPYQLGSRGPLEDVWARSIDKPYDDIIKIWRTSPIDSFGDMLGLSTQTVDSGLKVSNGAIYNRKTIKMHGDVVNGERVSYEGLLQYAMLCLRELSIDFDFTGKRNSIYNSKILFGYPVSGFVSDYETRVSYKKNSKQYGTIGNTPIVKKTTSYNEAMYTTLRCYVGNAPTSEIRAGVRVPVGKGSDWEFVVVTMDAEISSIKLFKPSPVITSSFDHTANGVTQKFNVHGHTNEVVEYTIGTSIADVHSLFAGVEGLLTFINCYENYLLHKGFVMDSAVEVANGASYGSLAYDAMNSIYGGMGSSIVTPFLGHWHPVQVVVGTNSMRTASGHKFKVGQNVQFYSTGKLPSPLIEADSYTIERIEDDTIWIKGIIFTTIGQGFISAGMHRVNVATPASFFEFNPFGAQIKISTPRGLVSTVNQGTFVTDQYGDRIEPRGIMVHRMDDHTTIDIRPNLVNPKFGMISKIGGVVVGIDMWEHVLLFENSSIEGDLWFEPSLGAYTPTIVINGRFDRNTNLKPRVGGAFLVGGKLESNIQTSIDAYSNMYEPSASDVHPIIEAGRRTYGFEEFEWMTKLGITTQTQFRFYQQMVRNVGLTESVKAMVNSKYFVDATIDEVWAYNTATYGSADRLTYNDLQPSTIDRYGDVSILSVDQRNYALNGVGARGTLEVSPVIIDTAIVSGGQTHNFNKQFDECEARFIVDPITTMIVYSGNFGVAGIFTSYHEIVCATENGDNVNYTRVGDFISMDVPYGTKVFVHGFGRMLNANEIIVYPGYGRVHVRSSVSPLNVRVTIKGHVTGMNFVDVVNKSTDYVHQRLGIWDPAAGVHNEYALTCIDHTGTDPALYDNGAKMWNDDQVGHVWWDTSFLHYKPYHNANLGDIDSVTAWGEQSEFSETNVYEWVASQIHPKDYDGEMAKIGDASKSYKLVAYRTRVTPQSSFGPWTVEEKWARTIMGAELQSLSWTVTVPVGQYAVYVGGTFLKDVDAQAGIVDLTECSGQVDTGFEIVKKVHIVTDDDLKFDPTKRDDGRLIHYGYVYPHNVSTKVNQYGNEIQMYHFWAQNTSNPHGTSQLSTSRLLALLVNSNRSFAFYAKPIDGKYNSVVVLNAGVIDDSRVVRIRGNERHEDAQNYSEWKMIRPGQRTVVPRVLWDRLTQALVGYGVSNGVIDNVPKPRVDIVLDDQRHGTNDKYGLGPHQIMCDSASALESLNSILLDPSVNLYPVDRVAFMSAHDDGTIAGKVQLMNDVYTSFSPEHVNTIWFRALYSGLALNAYYEGIMKTSYVHLDSVQALSV